VLTVRHQVVLGPDETLEDRMMEFQVCDLDLIWCGVVPCHRFCFQLGNKPPRCGPTHTSHQILH